METSAYSRARSTLGQENEAWALYKKNPSRVSWAGLSGDRYVALPKLATPAGNTFVRGLLLTWDKRDSPKQTTCSSARVKMRKKETCKRWCLHFPIFLSIGKFQFSKGKSLIDHDDKHHFHRLSKHKLGMCITPSHLIWLFIWKKRDVRAFFSHFHARTGTCSHVCLKWTIPLEQMYFQLGWLQILGSYFYPIQTL